MVVVARAGGEESEEAIVDFHTAPSTADTERMEISLNYR